MAGFLRKKSKQEPPTNTRPVVTAASTSSSPTSTPLFARFATTSHHAEPQKAVVSGPMMLSSNPRRDVPPVGQHRSHSTRGISNGMPINGQVRRDTVDYKPLPAARELPPQPRASYPQPHPQPRARPISRVSIDKPLPLPAEPVPAPKPIPTSALAPPPVQARSASPDLALGGEYAHLWSVIAGDDPNVLQGSPPSSNPPSMNKRNPPQNSAPPPPLAPSSPGNAAPTKPPIVENSWPSERLPNGFPTSHTNGHSPNAGKQTLEKLNDPSRHALLTDTNNGKRINPVQANGNAANMRSANPMEDEFGSQQPAPPPPIKHNASMSKSRPTSTYVQPPQAPERIVKQDPNHTLLPSPSNSPDSNRRLTRAQETPSFNGEWTPAASRDKQLPSSSNPDVSRLTSPSQIMGASTSSLGAQSIRSSVYKDIRTEDISTPPPPQPNVTQQPSPPVSPPLPRKSPSMRQSLNPGQLSGRGKPLIFAAMASVDPEPENQPPPPASFRPSDRPPVEPMNARNNVPPQQQQQQPPPPHFQNHNQFHQQQPPPQSYRPPQPADGPYPSRQNSLNQPGRGPPQPYQTPPNGQYQQVLPARSSGSMRQNNRGPLPPQPQPGPGYAPQPAYSPPPQNNLPPPQSFQQAQHPLPQPPHGPRPSYSPPRDATAQLRMSPEPHRASPTKGRRLSKKPPPGSDVASIRSQKRPGSGDKRPGSGHDKSQPQPQLPQLQPQPQFQQRPPQPPHHNHLVKQHHQQHHQPPPPMVSITPGPPPHAIVSAPPPPPEKLSVDRDPLGVPLHDDPFAKSDGVKMLSPFSKDGRGDFLGVESDADGFHSTSESPSPRLSQNIGPSEPMVGVDNHGELGEGEGERLPTVEEIPNDGKDRLTEFLAEPALLSNLLSFFSFYDWCMLLSLSREIRFRVVSNPELREAVLEQFLQTVGYSRWTFNDPEPLSLSLQDLNDYMRGVSTPTHEYARVSALYIHSLGVHPSHRDQSLDETVANLSAATRAYTRVVLRLRAQAEKEASIARRNGRNSGSRPGSRAPSPTYSSLSHSNHGHRDPPQPQRSAIVTSGTFQSPLFRLRRAPLLRVFVPSPDGDWLSDKSVLECEAELKRAGVLDLMRIGDVVWDVAVGDEGNVGRLVWDGTYLIDLDYTYAAAGDLPKYLPTLGFPPSYFHRVIRSGPGSSNPIAHIDIRPWGEEIAANLQLLQDRVRTETPQGAHHNVVRWVHRSSFQIRPVPRNGRAPNSYSHRGSPHQGTTRVPIPGTSLFVDPGWYGTIVLETEGTNESLADLQERCGPGAFPPRPHHHHGSKGLPAEQDRKMVYRIMREKSRPGEIWIRTVSAKERLL